MIFGPMLQVGCASASSGVTSASSSRVRPRNGPPDAVSTSESTVSRARPSRHWKAAECSLSTGQQQPSAPLLRRERELAGRDEALLVRERERRRRARAPRASPASPAKPTTALRTRSGSAALEQLGQVAADLRAAARSAVDRLRAGRGGDELELGMRLDDLDRLAADRAGRAEQRDRVSPRSSLGGLSAAPKATRT